MPEWKTMNIVRSEQEINGKYTFRMWLPNIEPDDEQTVPMLLSQLESGILNDLSIKGVPEITKCNHRKSQDTKEAFVTEDGGYVNRKDVFVIETDGVALKKVLCFAHVDKVRTNSNYIKEILSVFGIEAARSSLLGELRVVLGSYGIYVNYRHLGTLCDIMTTRGHLMAITRHGINRVD